MLPSRLEIPLSLVLAAVVAGLPLRVRASGPPSLPPVPGETEDGDEPPPDANDEPGPDPGPPPTEDVPPPPPDDVPPPPPEDETPLSTDSAAPVDPPPIPAYDRPDLARQDPYPDPINSAQEVVRVRRRAKAGGLLVGAGLAAAVVAPIVIVRPRPAIRPDAGDGTTLNLRTSAGPIIAGSLVSVSGGVLTVLGGRMLSDLGVERARAVRRQHGLAVVSGVAFGVAAGLVVSGVVELARGRVLWNKVLAREFSPEDLGDADDASRRMSRGLALFAAALPLAGLGLGLSLGNDARAKVVPTARGVAVLGRF